MSSPTILHKIALPYRIFFLYIEPVLALSGTYLCFSNPERFVTGTTPLPAILAASPRAISPIMLLLLTNIGAWYLLFAINEAIVLRCTMEKSVCK